MKRIVSPFGPLQCYDSQLCRCAGGPASAAFSSPLTALCCHLIRWLRSKALARRDGACKSTKVLFLRIFARSLTRRKVYTELQNKLLLLT